jgi:PAS domain S-box-containing protein
MHTGRGLVYKRGMLRGGENPVVEKPALPLWQRMAWLGAGFFLCAWLGRFLSGGGGTMVDFWLPGGLFVSALLLNATRDWPWLVLAAVPANALFDVLHDPNPKFAVILFFCVANVVQSGAGAWLVRRFVAEKPLLTSLKEFFGLMFFAGVVGSAIGASIGATMLVQFHLTKSFVSSWKILWGGNAMAVLVLAPLILACCDFRKIFTRQNFNVARVAEGLLVFGGLAVFLGYRLMRGGGIAAPKVPVLLFVLWAGLRFGLRGAAAAVFLLAVESAYLTTHFLRGLTPANLAAGDYVFTLQVFVAVAAMVGLVPPIVLAERDRTLAKLRDSESRFRSLTEAAFEGVFISEDGRILDANDQGLKMFGYARTEMIGREILELVAPSSRAAVAEALDAQRESIYGYELLRKDGSSFFAEAQAKRVQLGGRTLRMTALRDVTARLQAEQALRESEEKFSKAFRVSPDAISITDFETGRFIEVNDSFERFFECKRDEVIGRTSQEMGFWGQPADRERLLALMRQHGSVRDFRTIGRTRAGELRRGLISAEVVQIAGRQSLVLLVRDITEQEKAEELDRFQIQVLQMIATGRPVRETLDALLRMVESQSPEMLTSILLLDPDGVHLRLGAAPTLPAEFAKAFDGVAIGPRAGSCGAAMFRREPVYVADIATDPLWADYKQFALPHGLRACWSSPIFDSQRNVLGTFAIYRRETVLPDERHLRLISMATDTAAICISKHRSETEREQAIAREQAARIEYTLQLIAAQEAERKRIAAELHDSMGQNLLLIKNLAQLALRSQSPEQAYEQVATINNLAARCIAEARQISRDLHPYQLDHLGLKRALEAMLENAAQASAIQFTSKLEAVDEFFPTDAAMNLYRIVQESLNNVLKHSHARRVDIRLERDIHEVLLRIEDDGDGFNVKNAGSHGLGLKNITERVRMLGGKLKVDSSPGKGTRVEVAIPIADPSDAAKSSVTI